MPIRLTNKKFIEKCISYYGDRFTYEKTNYISNMRKVIITCRLHGDIKILPKTFTCHRRDGLINHGCRKCYENARRHTLEKFIDQSIEIHGLKYNYNKCNYINANTRVIIECPIHGEFEQTPHNHLESKIGCFKCIRDVYDTESFIKKSKEIHGDIYEYDKSIYINSKTNIILTCKEHGDFIIKPDYHINDKYGCNCKKHRVYSIGELIIKTFLESNDIEYIKEYKIDKCKNINSLRFDFYLPESDILIEYDGEQHFKPVKFYGGVEGYKNRINNDSIKNYYCLSNNRRLIRIKFNESIKDRLIEENIIPKNKMIE